MMFAMLYIYVVFKNILENEFYYNLRSKAIMTAEMTVGYPNFKQTDETNSNQLSINKTISENISIYDLKYDKVYSYYPTEEQINSEILRNIVEKKEVKFSKDDMLVYGIFYQSKGGPSYIIISEALFNHSYLQILKNILISIFIIQVVIVAVSGWVFAGRALSPIRKIINEVNSIHPSNLDFRLITTQKNDEISRLVKTFNKLLDRIQTLFSTQKQFLSNVSHELKNPLSIIKSQIEISLVKPQTEKEYISTLSSIQEDITDLNDVILKLMDLSKLSPENTIDTNQKLRIDELIWSAKSALLKSRKDYRVDCKIENLPTNEEMLYVDGSEQLLKTAVVNIMENSCKYSEDKSVFVTLSVEEDGHINLVISDNGIGIPEEEIPSILDPFFRSNIVSGIKGSGVGLSIVNSILKLHNIEYSIKNREEKGTTTRLVFPKANLKTA